MDKCAPTFNGVDLSKYITITNELERAIGTTRSNNLLNVGKSDFQRYKDYRLESKKIPMPFKMIFNLPQKRRELAQILNVSEPAKLIFPDEPDIYYLAVPDGDAGLKEQNFLGSGTINWLVPDGVAHAIEEKEYTNQQKVTHACDFKGKLSGSVAENPHVVRKTADTVLISPSTIRGELTQNEINGITDLDGKITLIQNKTKDNIVQALIYFDLVTDIDRSHPGLFELYGATTTVQKADVAKKLIGNETGSLNVNVYGFGSGPEGNLLTASVWDPINPRWLTFATNKTNEIANAKYLGKSWAINSDGFVYIVAYAPASDGVTPSAVNFDYVSLEYTLTFPDNTIKIDNNGTYKTYPVLETTMQSDNGLVAFINSNGALLQFGNPDEVDSVGYQESDWVVNDRLFTQTEVEKAGWKVNDVTFPDKLMGKYTLTPNGTIKYKTADGVPLATAGNWGTSSEYHGVTLSRDISPDSQGYVGAKNFEVRFGLYFITGQLNQTGLALVELRDKNDKQVCSISFVKNASTNNVGTIRLNVRGNVFYEQRYETNMWNIYTNINTEFSIVKHGNEFNFHLGGIKNGGFIKTYRDDTQTETEVTKIVWFGGIFGASSTPMENSIRSVTMQKHNVDKLRDIPNQFGKGDVLRVDPESGTVYINGLETYGWALGNDYERFILEPGENTIRCLVSSWVKQENMPKIKVINREAYL